VPLYFAATRPTIVRDGQILMQDDERLQPKPGEKVEMRKIRFRTLGCYPLTAAIESNADTIEAVVAETLNAQTSEREGRLIDYDQIGAMEKKKQEGYF
jgi:sulfate adenylyltransferase subunit 2